MFPYNVSLYKKTKIVATLGPASSSLETIKDLIKAGVNVFRLNFSHGTHESHLSVIKNIRQAQAELDHPVGILGDLCGPKLRLGVLPPKGVLVKAGTIIELVSDQTADGSNRRFPISIPCFEQVAKPGNHILIDDGNIILTVTDNSNGIVKCKMETDGILKSRKGVNVPDTPLPVPALTDKDKLDMKFALENDVDILALSFVRREEDLLDAYTEMRSLGKRLPLFAKIEMAEATHNLEEIISTCDGTMVARGDLGCEIPIEEVPLVQKSIIALCNKQMKPVITATQMLESMITSVRPTRAEVTDIFNAILDGTDAVMLSGETAAGAHPVEAVEMMSSVAMQAEKLVIPFEGVQANDTSQTIADALCRAAVEVAGTVKADCILVPTWSGATAMRVSNCRPTIPIFACSSNQKVVNTLSIAWGIEARQFENIDPKKVKSMADALVGEIIDVAKKYAVVEAGQTVVVIAGTSLGSSGGTNMIRVVEI